MKKCNCENTRNEKRECQNEEEKTNGKIIIETNKEQVKVHIEATPENIDKMVLALFDSIADANEISKERVAAYYLQKCKKQENPLAEMLAKIMSDLISRNEKANNQKVKAKCKGCGTMADCHRLGEDLFVCENCLGGTKEKK